MSPCCYINPSRPRPPEIAPSSPTLHGVRKRDQCCNPCISPASRYVPPTDPPSAIDYNWPPVYPGANLHALPVASSRTPPIRAPSRGTSQPSATHQIPPRPYKACTPFQKSHSNMRQSTEQFPHRYSLAGIQTARPLPLQYQA